MALPNPNPGGQAGAAVIPFPGGGVEVLEQAAHLDPPPHLQLNHWWLSLKIWSMFRKIF